MCLSLKFKTEKEAKKALKPLIAKQDIIVYKKLAKTFDDKTFSSPLRGYIRWQRGDHMYQVAGKNDPIFTKSKIQQLMSGKWCFRVSVGLHSAATKYQANNAVTSGIIFQMIIPKGSKYYTNGKLYVSNNLIFPYK